MPKRPQSKCAAGDCYEPATIRGRCTLHAKQSYQQDQRTRGTSTERQYDARWRKARTQHLLNEPLCRPCKAQGIYHAGTIVDHIIPHRGDPVLFWDSSNWQTICTTQHAIKSNKERNQGVPWRPR